MSTVSPLFTITVIRMIANHLSFPCLVITLVLACGICHNKKMGKRVEEVIGRVVLQEMGVIVS